MDTALAATVYDGARRGAQVAVIVAAIGVLVDILVVTGFPQKLSFAMLEMAGESLWLLLLIAAGSCLAFGLGIAHLGGLHPRRAPRGAGPRQRRRAAPRGAYVRLLFRQRLGDHAAGCQLVPCGLQDRRRRFHPHLADRASPRPAGFILPFLFVIHPEILRLDASVGRILLASAMALIGVVALNVMLEGFLLAPINLIQRLLLAPAAFGLLEPGLGTSVAGLLMFALVVLWQLAARPGALPSRKRRGPPG